MQVCFFVILCLHSNCLQHHNILPTSSCCCCRHNNSCILVSYFEAFNISPKKVRDICLDLLPPPPSCFPLRRPSSRWGRGKDILDVCEAAFACSSKKSPPQPPACPMWRNVVKSKRARTKTAPTETTLVWRTRRPRRASHRVRHVETSLRQTRRRRAKRPGKTVAETLKAATPPAARLAAAARAATTGFRP